MENQSLINDSYGLIALFLLIPAIIFKTAEHPKYGKIFNIIPSIVFAYFIPTLLANIGIIPSEAPIYNDIGKFVLPASLLLLTIAVDIKGIINLGPKVVIMFLTATLGIVLGGPLALFLWGDYLPVDIWRGMGALAGSWIGGGANFLAMADNLKVPSDMIASMVFVDVVAANIWTGTLMYFAARYKILDKKLGADNSAVENLIQRVETFRLENEKVATTSDYMVLAAAAFSGSWICLQLGNLLPEIGDIISHSTWKMILITTLGVALSFTTFKKYEGTGASKLGQVLLYMLICKIGASANFSQIIEYPFLAVMGLTWIVFHAVIMLLVMKLIKAPLFFMAVGSQANVGGAASAPVVASAFHPALSTVGVMLGVAGYVLGTYAAIMCAYLLKVVS